MNAKDRIITTTALVLPFPMTIISKQAWKQEREIRLVIVQEITSLQRCFKITPKH